jgi:hypothetical protein
VVYPDDVYVVASAIEQCLRAANIALSRGAQVDIGAAGSSASIRQIDSQ